MSSVDIMLKRLKLARRCIEDADFAKKNSIDYGIVMHELSNDDVLRFYTNDVKDAGYDVVLLQKELDAIGVDVLDYDTEEAEFAVRFAIPDDYKLPLEMYNRQGKDDTYTFGGYHGSGAEIIVTSPVPCTDIKNKCPKAWRSYYHNIVGGNLFGLKNDRVFTNADKILHALLWHRFEYALRYKKPTYTHSTVVNVEDLRANADLSLFTAAGDLKRQITYVGGVVNRKDADILIGKDVMFEGGVKNGMMLLPVPVRDHDMDVVFVLAKYCMPYDSEMLRHSVVAVKAGKSTIKRQCYLKRHHTDSTQPDLEFHTWLCAPLCYDELCAVAGFQYIFGECTCELREFVLDLPKEKDFAIFNLPGFYEQYSLLCEELGASVQKVFAVKEDALVKDKNDIVAGKVFRYMNGLHGLLCSPAVYNFMVRIYFDKKRLLFSPDGCESKKPVWVDLPVNSVSEGSFEYAVTHSEIGQSYLKRVKQSSVWVLGVSDGKADAAWKFVENALGYLRICVTRVTGITPTSDKEYVVLGSAVLEWLLNYCGDMRGGNCYNAVYLDYVSVFENICIICTADEKERLAEYSEYLAEHCKVLDQDTVELEQDDYKGASALNAAFGLSLIDAKHPERFAGCYDFAYWLGLHNVIHSKLPSFTHDSDYLLVDGDKIHVDNLAKLQVYACFTLKNVLGVGVRRLVWTSAGFIVVQDNVGDSENSEFFTCVALSNLYTYMRVDLGVDFNAERLYAIYGYDSVSELSLSDSGRKASYFFEVCDLAADSFTKPEKHIFGTCGVSMFSFFDKHRFADFFLTICDVFYYGENSIFGGSNSHTHKRVGWFESYVLKRRLNSSREDFVTFHGAEIKDIIHALCALEYLAQKDVSSVELCESMKFVKHFLMSNSF